MDNGGRGHAMRKNRASERGELPWRPFSFSFYTAEELILAVNHDSLPRGQHLCYHVAAGYQPAHHCLLRPHGNRGGTTVRSDIRAHGAVTPRSKAGSGPRYDPSRQLLCADFLVRCDIIRDVMDTESFIRVLYESTQSNQMLKLLPSRVPPWRASLHSNIFHPVYDGGRRTNTTNFGPQQS